MATIPRALADHFARNHGIASLDAMARYGLSIDQVRSLCADGGLVRVHNGVYRVRSSPDTFDARCAAVSAAHRSIAVTGRAAGRLWGLRRMGSSPIIVGLAPLHEAPSLKGVRIRRTSDLSPTDVVERDDGIRVVSPARLFFELAIDLSDDTLESVTEQLLDQHLELPQLLAVRSRLAVPGRRGAARANRVLATRLLDDAPADSELELRVLRALERRGLRLVRQYPLVLPDGRTIHLDGADPTIGWGMEVDHVTWHGGRIEAQRDKVRDRLARRLGWQVDRVTDVELTHDFPGAIDELVELHAHRATHLPPNFAALSGQATDRPAELGRGW